MKHRAIRQAFADFLKTRSLKLTTQRRRIFDRAFATHEHFSAEELYAWLSAEPGDAVSRATVYRTLGLLVEGNFMRSLDAGRDELVYEHILGHAHHDHMVCLDCGRIEEFADPRIEAAQMEACERKGWELVNHDLRLMGYCKSCRKKRAASGVRDANRAVDESARGSTQGARTAGE